MLPYSGHKISITAIIVVEMRKIHIDYHSYLQYKQQNNHNINF